MSLAVCLRIEYLITSHIALSSLLDLNLLHKVLYINLAIDVSYAPGADLTDQRT